MVKLLPGEILCKYCKGSGLLEGELKKYKKSGFRRTLIFCGYCCGEGKLDWIDAVNGQHRFTECNWLAKSSIKQHIKGNVQERRMFNSIVGVIYD